MEAAVEKVKAKSKSTKSETRQKVYIFGDKVILKVRENSYDPILQNEESSNSGYKSD
jgi:hypothetical protein